MWFLIRSFIAGVLILTIAAGVLIGVVGLILFCPGWMSAPVVGVVVAIVIGSSVTEGWGG